MKVFWEKMINLDPKICILNMYPNNLVPAANIRALLRIGLLEAKRCFAKCWKDKKKYVDFVSGLMDGRLYELWRK